MKLKNDLGAGIPNLSDNGDGGNSIQIKWIFDTFRFHLLNDFRQASYENYYTMSSKTRQ